jgi:hypothetical protein
MGKKLLSFFERANDKGGLSSQIKLVMITKMAQDDAAQAPDSPENIKLFEDALAKV